MGININLQPDISLQEAAAKQAEGFSVMRSAHVGNLRPYNLTVASLGIPMLLVDHNIATQQPDENGDKNYLPGSIVTRTGIEPLPINNPAGLSLQNKIADNGQFLDEFHGSCLATAFPETPFFTNTTYLRDNEAVSGEIVTIAHGVVPELFKRVVESDGKVRRTDGSFADLVETYGVLQLNDSPRTDRGVLMPNAIDIVANFVIECLKSGRSTQYHLSGPDMKIYSQQLKQRSEFDKLYAAIKSEASFGPMLPESLDVELIPADVAIFATHRSRAYRLLGLFAHIRYKQFFEEQKAAFFRSAAAQDPDTRAEVGAKKKQQSIAINQELRQAATDVGEVFTAPKEAPFVSQYDLLEREESLVFPAENIAMKLSDLSRLVKQLQKLRGKGT